MDDDRIVDEIVARIRQETAIKKVVLFGSRARGEARPSSDYDLLIVKNSPEPRHHRAGPYYRTLADLPVEVEVVVYTPEEILLWSEVPLAFITTILREGKVIYENKS